MLSFNDALAHSPSTATCFACNTEFPSSSAYWYDAAAAISQSPLTFDGTQLVVPVCPSCHVDPTSWMPQVGGYNVPGYLASRPCEALDSG